MLFTAPAFLFLFLPLSLIVYTLFSKNRKRNFIFAICILFYVPFIFTSPLTVIMLAATAVYTYIAGRLVKCNKSKPLLILLCVIPVSVLIAAKNLAYAGTADYTYPIGLTVATLASLSYINDVRRGDAAGKDGLMNLIFYIFFFPVMIAGPFIKFKEFIKVTDSENIHFSLHDMSVGVKLFMMGFVKRMTVGAVLIESYERFIKISNISPNPLISVLSLFLVFFIAYFVFSGYSDMAAGIARMFGIRIRRDFNGVLRVYTLRVYSESFFMSFFRWVKDYIVNPLNRRFDLKGNAKLIIHTCIYCLAVTMLIRSDIFALPMALPLIAMDLVGRKLRLKERLRDKTGIKLITGLFTIFVVSLYWTVFMFTGSSVLEYVSELSTLNAEYRLDRILVAFSGVKHRIVLIIAAIMIIPNTELATLIRKKASAKMAAVIDYASSAALILVFAFTVIFVLPQFPQYDTLPFLRLYI